MLIVRTYVAPSRIHGMGVFAAEPIRIGTPVWVFDPIIDQEITRDELTALPEAVRDIAFRRSFSGPDGRIFLSRDNGVFLNHSEEPNISSNGEQSLTLRDLSKGEELTEDYRLLPPGACRAFLDDPSQIHVAKSKQSMIAPWPVATWRPARRSLCRRTAGLSVI